MYINLFRRILEKFREYVSSLRFRIRFYIYRGNIRVDWVTTEKSEVGQQVHLRGCISSKNSLFASVI